MSLDPMYLAGKIPVFGIGNIDIQKASDLNIFGMGYDPADIDWIIDNVVADDFAKIQSYVGENVSENPTYSEVRSLANEAYSELKKEGEIEKIVDHNYVMNNDFYNKILDSVSAGNVEEADEAEESAQYLMP